MHKVEREPLAIVGIGCRFPGGATSPDSLWQLLRNGIDAIGEVPADRWDHRRFFHPDATVPGKTYARHGGFLTGSPYDFDAAFFGLSTREAAILDPQQRLLLESAWEALEDAGHDILALRRRPIGVFVGAFSLDNLIDRFGIVSRDHLSAASATSSSMVMLSNRLSHAFDFTGPSLSVDTACSSSLVAAHLACASVWSGESEMALAAGVNVMLAPEAYIAMAKGGFLSRRGRCAAFDESADGYVRAEGAGVVVIKPLSAALAAGDRVYACLRAIGVNQDGHTPGIATPNPDSQRAVIRQVLREAGVDAREIRYVEAHGPGTQAGDPVEAESLGLELGAGRDPQERLWVGSIKTSIGHTEAAAGIAGLIKTALVLHHREVAPNLHFRTPNPRVPLDDLGLRVPVDRQPLPPTSTVYAAINSFGYGGTNAHAILCTPPEAHGPTHQDDSALPADIDRLYPISARDDTALAAVARSVADATERLSRCDIGHTLGLRRAHHSVRAAVWARSASGLREDLRDLDRARAEGRASVGRAPEHPRRLLFLYTGMGAQYVGMGRQLFAEHPIFRAAIERCDGALGTFARSSLVEFFGGAQESSFGTPISAPEEAQVPNVAMQIALTEMWRSFGVEPHGVIGHSAGELAAAWAAGALTLEDAMRITYQRGIWFQRVAHLGSMLAVGLGSEAAEPLLAGRGDGLAIGAILAPDSVIIAGSLDALDALAAELTAADVFHRRLYVDAPYHHAYVDPVGRDMREGFGRVRAMAPRLPLYSPLRGGLIAEACQDENYWWASARQVANFEAAITAALNDGFDAVLEIGPSRQMAAAVKSCAGAASRSVWLGTSVVRGEPELSVVRRTLADMYVEAVPIDWSVLQPDGCFVRLPSYPWQRTRLWQEAPAARATHVLDSGDALLHQQQDAPSPAWQTDLSSAVFPYLFHHVVGGAALFPGAGYLAAMLAASRALGRGNSLEAVRFERALALTETSSLRIDVDETTGVCTVSARPGRDDAWQRYASGRVALARAPRTARVDLDDAWHRRPSHMTAEALYRTLAERDLAYGPLFQAVREIKYGADDVVASIALPEGVAEAGELHPVLLDGAFQALAAVASSTVARGPWVPVSVDEIRLHGASGPEAWAIARVTDRTPSSFTASLCLFDATGTVTAEVDGLRCQRLPTAADADPLARIAFEDRWERSPTPPVRRIAVQGWLLVDGQDIAGQLAAELGTYGQQCRIRAGGGLEPERGFRIDHVVWMSPSIDGADAGIAISSRLLHVVQALAKWPVPPRLVIVTRGAFGATPRADQASVWGLGRVVATEHPQLHATLVDCDADEQAAIWLARELVSDTLEREVALGAGGRQVARLQAWSAPPQEPEMVDVGTVPVVLRLGRAGLQDSLAWHEFRRRAPGPGEVEIRATAAAINFKDVLKSMNLLSSAYLERTFFGDTLGMETAGIVTRCGEEVTAFVPGDEVVMVAPHFASYLIAPSGIGVRRPTSLPAVESPIFTNYVTAYYGLVDIARLQPKERVLVHLASGGVGQAAIAIARMVGAEVFATAGSDEKRDYLRRQGISHVFDSRSLDFADQVMDVTGGAGVDVVLNSLSGEALRRSWDILASYGRFVEIGKRDIEDNAPLFMRRFDENRSFAAVDIDRMVRERPAMFQRILSDVERLFADGRIGPLPVQAFPASQVVDAFRLMSRARHIGKVVIDFRDQRVPAVRLARQRVRADRTYLVTGAFGGFGRALARWLVREGAGTLVLVGRRGAQSPGADSLVSELTAAGARVAVRAVDVANLDAVRALMAGIRRDGPPLAGVFHAAMVLDDEWLSALDARRFDAVMAPKALGAWNLHTCTVDDPIEHFVLFSSVAQVLGNVRQGAYCAANGFLDGLARRRRADGRPALAIAWGLIGDAGVAARTDGLVAQLERLGIRALTTTQALAALGPLMDGAPASLAIADLDWAAWAAHAGLGTTPRFGHVVKSSADGDRLSTFRRELAAQPPAERAAALESMIRADLGTVLGTPPDRLPTDRSIESFGVDSLMAVELALALEERSGVRLSTSLLMQGPTISTLASHLLAEALAVKRLDESAVESLSDAETDAMLEQLAASGDLDLSAAI